MASFANQSITLLRSTLYHIQYKKLLMGEVRPLPCFAQHYIIFIMRNCWWVRWDYCLAWEIAERWGENIYGSLMHSVMKTFVSLTGMNNKHMHHSVNCFLQQTYCYTQLYIDKIRDTLIILIKRICLSSITYKYRKCENVRLLLSVHHTLTAKWESIL